MIQHTTRASQYVQVFPRAFLESYLNTFNGNVSEDLAAIRARCPYVPRERRGTRPTTVQSPGFTSRQAVPNALPQLICTERGNLYLHCQPYGPLMRELLKGSVYFHCAQQWVFQLLSPGNLK